jgi:hypothetical protein
MNGDGVNNGDDKRASIARASGRGPSYPALSLEEAVDKAQKFWMAAKRGSAAVAAVAKHWGYSETSSTGKTAVAALLQFGLLQAEGSLDSRTVKLTGRGLDIVLDEPSSPRRWLALKDAVQTPKLYADILAKWPPHELPVDSMLRYYLIREKSFNEVSVDGFIKDFRASLAFAKLDIPATIEAGSEVIDELEADTESMSATTVEPVQAVAGKAFMAASHAVATNAPAVSPAVAYGAALHVGPSEREWLRGPLSREAGYRLLVTGSMGPREIGKLIKLLEAQKSVLDDDDDEEM